MIRPFRVPTRLVMAPGCFASLPEVVAGLLAERGAEEASARVVLVTDPGIEATGLPERGWESLVEAGIEAITFDDVEPNPRVATVDRLAAWGREEGVALVVGVGGGSVLDAAKAAAMMIPNPGSVTDYEGRNRYPETPLPFVAVPTTCGTGSEVTWVSVLSDEERQAKISVKGESMFPRWALVDADLLRSLPGPLVATTGVDALTHALEATTCKLANPVSDALAREAISLLLRYLRSATHDIAGDAEAREQVMRASTLAGLAFGNADVGAVHCLSETLGGRYDLPHGLLNAVLLPPVLRHNFAATERKLAALAEDLPLRFERSAEGLIEEVEQLTRDLGVPSFRDLRIPEADHPWIAERAAQNGSNPSNAVEMTPESYLGLLRGL
jgi:alcohol dehydrogenase